MGRRRSARDGRAATADSIRLARTEGPCIAAAWRRDKRLDRSDPASAGALRRTVPGSRVVVRFGGGGQPPACACDGAPPDRIRADAPHRTANRRVDLLRPEWLP